MGIMENDAQAQVIRGILKDGAIDYEGAHLKGEMIRKFRGPLPFSCVSVIAGNDSRSL
jgi:hypothetical protein